MVSVAKWTCVFTIHLLIYDKHHRTDKDFPVYSHAQPGQWQVGWNAHYRLEPGWRWAQPMPSCKAGQGEWNSAAIAGDMLASCTPDAPCLKKISRVARNKTHSAFCIYRQPDGCRPPGDDQRPSDQSSSIAAKTARVRCNHFAAVRLSTNTTGHRLCPRIEYPSPILRSASMDKRMYSFRFFRPIARIR